MLYRLIGKLVFVAVLVMPWLSCAQVPQRTTLVESARAPGKVPSVRDSGLHQEEPCLVVISSFADRRLRDGEIGEIDGRPVKNDDIVAWLRHAFETELEIDGRMQVVRGDPDGRGVYVDAEILSVYIVDEQETLIANVVMRLNYSLPGGNFAPELAYGSTTVDENIGKQSAIREVFEIALSDLVAGTRDSLARICMSAKNGGSVKRERIADLPAGR